MTHPPLPRRLDYYALLQEAKHNELDVERNEDRGTNGKYHLFLSFSQFGSMLNG